MSTIALTHDEILKALCDNAPLSDDQRAALVSLVSADKRGQELWDYATRWQPIETAPQDGRTVLLGYANSHGRWRTLRGQWMSQEFIDENWEEPENGEPGWYETSVENDDVPNCWRTRPTHWMPLPKLGA